MTREDFINLLVKKGTPRDKITIENGLINVDGNVYLSYLGLTEIPYPFGIVTGGFYCYYNNLTTLVGVPQFTGGKLIIDNCYLNNYKKVYDANTEIISSSHIKF